MSEPAKLLRLELERAGLLEKHPGWRIWFVPNALDGSVTWCAQREPAIHAYSPQDLSKDIGLAEEDLAARLARQAKAALP